MLKIGSIILSLWCILGMIPSAAIFVMITFLGGNAPPLAIQFSEAEISAISLDVLAAALVQFHQL